MNIKSMKLSTFVCFILIIFTSVYFTQSFTYVYWDGYGPGAGFMPRWCSGILLILLIVYFVKSLKEEGINLSEAFPKGIGRINILITWAALIFFAVFSKKMGLVITSIVMLTVLFGRSMKWYKAVLIGTVVTLCCFYLFKIVLKVPVPVNKLGW